MPDTLVEKCFCGRNLSNSISCGSKECHALAEQYGSVTNWLVLNVKEIGKNSLERLDKIELQIVFFLKKKFGANQRTIAHETGLAKSQVSKAIISLEQKRLVIKDDFHDENGELYTSNGRRPTTWRFIDTN